MPRDQSRVLLSDHKIPGSPLLFLLPIPRAVPGATARGAVTYPSRCLRRIHCRSSGPGGTYFPHAAPCFTLVVEAETGQRRDLEHPRAWTLPSPARGWHSPPPTVWKVIYLASLCSRAARYQVVLMPTHLGTAEAGLEQASLSPEKVESEPRPRKRKPSGPSNVSLLRGEAGDHGLTP